MSGEKLNLHTRELRLKLLEERLLNENIGLSEEQQRALHEFNPCLRERPMESPLPGLLLIQDVIDLGALKKHRADVPARRCRPELLSRLRRSQRIGGTGE